MRNSHFFLSFLLIISCGSDSIPVLDADVGDSGIVDVAEDLDSQQDLKPEERCRRDSDCTRGTTCHSNICAGARGCVFLSDFEPQIGCFFDHGMDFDEGLFSPTECAVDNDCTDPTEPNCIARICSGLMPCTDDDECPEELTCRYSFYCK